MLNRVEKRVIKEIAIATRSAFIAEYKRPPVLDTLGDSPDWKRVPWNQDALEIGQRLTALGQNGGTGSERWAEYKKYLTKPLKASEQKSGKAFAWNETIQRLTGLETEK
jgi:hypothetical protein